MRTRGARPATTADKQLDLLDMLAADQEQWRADAPAPTLYASSARGPAQRDEEFRLWTAQWGRAGAAGRSHAWTTMMTIPSHPTPTCRVAVLTALIGCTGHDECSCVGNRGGDGWVYRGTCRCCDWESTHVRGDADSAALDALDHAHPGWRDSPVLSWSPNGHTKVPAWHTAMRQLYGDRPDGWPVIAQPVPHDPRMYEIPESRRRRISAWPGSAWDGLSISPQVLELVDGLERLDGR